MVQKGIFSRASPAFALFHPHGTPVSGPCRPCAAGQGHGTACSPHDSGQTRLDSLSEEQRQNITAQFNQFFELTPAEKRKTLNALSDPERRQMERTLETFGQLPRAQRQQCLRAFTEFAGMSAPEKQDFLKNAERWSQMSPKERQTWRDLVTHVPEWPPMPPESMPPVPPQVMPPMPPQMSQRFFPVASTNPN